MRIIQVANFVHPTSGGLATVMSSLRSEYLAMGHEVVELVPRSGDSAFDHAHRQRIVLDAVRLPLSGGYRVIIRRGELIRSLLELRPDLVELHDKTTLHWLPIWCRANRLACVLVSHERTDLVASERGIIRAPLRLLVAEARRRIESSATRIVCASRFAAAEFDDQSRVDVVPLGVDLDLFRPDRPDREWSDPLTIVMCGRLSPEKGVMESLEGIIRLATIRSLRVRIIGDGPLRERIRVRSIDRYDLTLVGHLRDRRMVARELASADLMINLGPRETFGLATLEAMASGTPVVVAKTGASSEIVDKGWGRTTDTEPESIASVIIDLLETPRPDLARAARLAAEGYTWHDTALGLLDMERESFGECARV